MLDNDTNRQHVCRAFMREVALKRQVWLVNGDDGYGRVNLPQPDGTTRKVTLFWSNGEEPELWSDLLAAKPRIEGIPPDVLVMELLPLLGKMGHSIGLDWTSEPIEAELSVPEFDRQLRAAMADAFTEQARDSGVVWLMTEDRQLATINLDDDNTILPVWSSRSEAHHSLPNRRGGAQRAIIRVPVGEFLTKHLVDAATHRIRVAPAYLPGPAAIHMAAWELKGAFKTDGEPVLRVA